VGLYVRIRVHHKGQGGIYRRRRWSTVDPPRKDHGGKKEWRRSSEEKEMEKRERERRGRVEKPRRREYTRTERHDDWTGGLQRASSIFP